MIIERQNNEIIIRLSGSVNIEAIQRVVDYFNALEIISQNQGTEEQAADLAREIDKKWWSENKDRFLP